MLDLLDPHDPEFTAHIIKLTRVAKGWRQADLARAVGVSRVRISQVELGRTPPGARFLDRLARALDSRAIRKLATSKRADIRRRRVVK